jgi:hypothetical protein
MMTKPTVPNTSDLFAEVVAGNQVVLGWVGLLA